MVGIVVGSELSVARMFVPCGKARASQPLASKDPCAMTTRGSEEW